jgi:hypothetical protein
MRTIPTVAELSKAANAIRPPLHEGSMIRTLIRHEPSWIIAKPSGSPGFTITLTAQRFVDNDGSEHLAWTYAGPTILA